MKARPPTLILAAAAVAAVTIAVGLSGAARGKTTPKPAKAVAPEIPRGREISGLQVRIRECPESERKKGKVMMIFEVRNTSDKPVEFCWWQSPLEGGWAGRFKVEGPNGKLIFHGPMVSRKPPSRKNGDFVTLRPQWTLAATFDLKKAYPLMEAGSTYSITFEGTFVGRLPASNTVRLKCAKEPLVEKPLPKSSSRFRCAACGFVYEKCSSCGMGPESHRIVNHPPVHKGCNGYGKIVTKK